MIPVPAAVGKNIKNAVADNYVDEVYLRGEEIWNSSSSLFNI